MSPSAVGTVSVSFTARTASGAACRTLGVVHAAVVVYDIHVPQPSSLKDRRSAVSPIVEGLTLVWRFPGSRACSTAIDVKRP